MVPYTRKFSTGATVRVDGFEIPCPVPDMPDEKDIINSELPTLEQKFKRTAISEDDFLSLSPFEQDAKAAEMWHIRRNGQWQFIKGKPVYLTGACWLYLNLWYAEYGDIPKYRVEAVEWFTVMDTIENDPDAFGMLDIKGRRCGDTEKALCYGYHVTSMIRKSWFGQQNQNDEDAEANFERIMQAHGRMPSYFKPKSPSDAIKKVLYFGLEKSNPYVGTNYDLQSRIDYKPAKNAAYDGKRLRFYYFDEFGKVDVTKINPKRQWQIIRPALSLENEKLVVGKAAFTTTAEHMGAGGGLLIVNDMWDNSDPTSKNRNNRTQTGLYRYFRSFLKGAEIDEYGDPLVEDAISRRNAEIDAYIEKGDFDGLSSYKRKFPATVEEALATPADSGLLNPAMIDMQLAKIAAEESGRITGYFPASHKPLKLASQGMLEWVGKPFESDVRFVPTVDGGWHVKNLPISPNPTSGPNRLRAPKEAYHAIGADTVDHMGTVGSRNAYAIFTPFHPAIDSAITFDQDGNPVDVEKMRTDQYDAIYVNRDADPDNDYEQLCMAMLFWGAKCLAERDKPGAILYAKRQGMSNYLMMKPVELNIGAKDVYEGAKASTSLIDTYIVSLRSHIARRIGTYSIKPQLDDLRLYNGSNRKKRDITVASGLAKLAATPLELGSRKNKKEWSRNPM